MPPTNQWESGALPVAKEAVPPLHADWNVELKKLVPSSEVIGYVAGVAVTDETAVVSFASFCASPPSTADCITMHLASFYRSTRKLRKSIEMKAKDLHSF
ncbi:MAG: hypothetical protein ACRD4H_10395, partial [Candidatus Acidiferrales bacterium]